MLHFIILRQKRENSKNANIKTYITLTMIHIPTIMKTFYGTTTGRYLHYEITISVAIK